MPIRTSKTLPKWASNIIFSKSEGGPLYQQLAEHLKALITSGILKLGEKMPTEAELCMQFGLSRITVRQALGILTNQGLIERFASKGTFVKQSGFIGAGEIRSIDDLVQQGIEMNTVIVSWRLITPPIHFNQHFKPSELVYRLRAVRTHNEVPIYFAENYLPKRIGDQLLQKELVNRTVVDLLKNKLNFSVLLATEEIQAGIADKALAERLWIKLGNPILIQKIELRCDQNEILQIGTGWWRGESFKRRYTFK